MFFSFYEGCDLDLLCEECSMYSCNLLYYVCDDSEKLEIKSSNMKIMCEFDIKQWTFWGPVN